jgi:hypothetical protein
MFYILIVICSTYSAICFIGAAICLRETAIFHRYNYLLNKHNYFPQTQLFTVCIPSSVPHKQPSAPQIQLSFHRYCYLLQIPQMQLSFAHSFSQIQLTTPQIQHYFPINQIAPKTQLCYLMKVIRVISQPHCCILKK